MNSISSLKWRVAAMACLSSSAVAAEPTTLNEPSIMRAVDAVVAEHRLYATCLSRTPQMLPLVQENWKREVSEAVDALKPLKPSPGFMAKFVAAVDFSNLLDRGMSLSAAIDLCQRNEKVVNKFHEFGYTRLGTAIRKAARGS